MSFGPGSSWTWGLPFYFAFSCNLSLNPYWILVNPFGSCFAGYVCLWKDYTWLSSHKIFLYEEHLMTERCIKIILFRFATVLKISFFFFSFPFFLFVFFWPKFSSATLKFSGSGAPTLSLFLEACRLLWYDQAKWVGSQEMCFLKAYFLTSDLGNGKSYLRYRFLLQGIIVWNLIW